MFMLWFVGGYLVEQVGRGNFLGIYLASGVVGSVVSLTNVVMRGVLYSSSLGASGAIAGIAAAYCTINPEYVP